MSTVPDSYSVCKCGVAVINGRMFGPLPFLKREVVVVLHPPTAVSEPVDRFSRNLVERYGSGRILITIHFNFIESAITRGGCAN